MTSLFLKRVEFDCNAIGEVVVAEGTPSSGNEVWVMVLDHEHEAIRTTGGVLILTQIEVEGRFPIDSDKLFLRRVPGSTVLANERGGKPQGILGTGRRGGIADEIQSARIAEIRVRDLRNSGVLGVASVTSSDQLFSEPERRLRSSVISSVQVP